MLLAIVTNQLDALTLRASSVCFVGVPSCSLATFMAAAEKWESYKGFMLLYRDKNPGMDGLGEAMRVSADPWSSVEPLAHNRCNKITGATPKCL